MKSKVLIALLALNTITAQATGNDYPNPNQTIHFVIGFPAGSSIDVSSRIIIEDIRSRTNAKIIVENKPGALGIMGVSHVASAAPDGYTLMPSSSATHSSAPFLSKAFKKHNVIDDFTHIGRLMSFDVALVTNAKGDYLDAQQLIDAAKKSPGSLSSGYGSGTGQVMAAAFATAANIDVLPIPYKGQPAAVVDLIGGRLDYVASDLGAVKSHIDSGALQAVMTISDQRSAALPNTPTAKELGLDSLDVRTWIGIAGPAGLPRTVVEWWENEIQESLSNPSTQEKIAAAGMDAAPLTGPQFLEFVTDQYEAWKKQIEIAGITAE